MRSNLLRDSFSALTRPPKTGPVVKLAFEGLILPPFLVQFMHNFSSSVAP
jgi:hypothetical protein